MTVPTAVWPGKPQPLGTTWYGQGVNVAVFSEWAERIDVCLYDVREPNRETARITLPERTRNVRHGYLKGVEPGTLYGFRAHGPYDPSRGLRFNANKLLVDPYARAIYGRVDPSPARFVDTDQLGSPTYKARVRQPHVIHELLTRRDKSTRPGFWVL